MDTWTAITSRRNVRQYTDEPVAPEALDQILEAGRRAPSASNAQWWDLVVVTDRQQLEELSGVWQGAGHVARSAVTVAVVAPEGADARQRDLIQYDLGQMTMQMMIAAAGLGIGSAHGAVADQDLARRVLGLPEDRLLCWLISLGHPADRPLKPIQNPNRRAFDEVVHRGTWSR